MKLIFSRKGLDSSAGSIASPIFPDGTYVSIPIPDRYSNIRYSEISLLGKNAGRLVENLSRGKLLENDFAHLDPDLDYYALKQRLPGWRPIFGQWGAAAAHLAQHKIDRGDIFLFFGWFRRVERKRNQWFYKVDAADLHVIFGWLQVGSVVRVDSESLLRLPWARYHPHLNSKRPCGARNNTLYIASVELTINGIHTGLPGAGIFRQFNQRLCLTADGCPRSLWRLPSWFFPGSTRRPLSFHQDLNRWIKCNRQVLLKTAPRGQEFVLQCDDYPEVFDWLLGLFELATESKNCVPQETARLT